ncbi:cellulase family glycosylhydrolase [Halomicrobium katesii]|uniref:cellulase family glycosylhydrolase n=1 Tax=Halomicrobium katesii TaxID=437163 RepID=UPI0003715C4D|nr:cellulase family glycosylhydrolase [Halomicrobium katesii]
MKRRNLLKTIPGLAGFAGVSGFASATDCTGVPEWDDSATYTGGDRVRYDGTLWTAEWWTKGTEPSTSASVWTTVGSCGGSDDGTPDDGTSGGPDCTAVASWDASVTYQSGTQAVHDGSLWEASWWTSGDEPGVSDWGPWTEVGPCAEDPNTPPSVSFGYPSEIRPGQEFTVGASASDPDGSIVSYEWDFGGGETAMGETATHVYETAGDYPVELTVTDDDGGTATTTQTVSVSEDTNETTPIKRHGQLRVDDTQLVDEQGDPVQLRGMSTHGIQWYGWDDCITDDGLDALADDWNADVLRISMYVQEGGYETDPEGFTQEVNRFVEEATDRGMYALIDWHQLSPGDPWANIDLAKQFFDDVVPEHADKDNVLYDIANEPNDVEWSRVRSYAEEMVPVIREYDADAVVMCGTHGWASLGVSDGASAQDIVDDPVEAENFMYTFHFYAASHGQSYRDELEWAAKRLPVFVSEWGAQEYTGDGDNDFESAQRFLDIMDEYDVSWTNWNYSDDKRSGAAWKEGSLPSGPWTKESLKESGVWVREKIRDS